VSRYSNTRPWNPKRPEVPVKEDGSWLSYPGWNQAGWEEVQPFVATLSVDHMETGRSSKIVVLKDELTNKTYPMFVADLVKGIQNGSLHVAEGKLTATWTGSKRGANYGIKAVRV